MKKTQLEWVKSQLAQYGEITRNQCLQERITRLSAIILVLKSEGFDFTTSRRGGDYVYKLASAPEVKKEVQYRTEIIDTPNGPVARKIAVLS